MNVAASRCLTIEGRRGIDDKRSDAEDLSAQVEAAQKIERPTVKGRKVAILIAGMHRSGTSAVARTLSLLGCDLPKTLMPAGRGNEAGHWESQAIMKLNDELLESAGSAWHDWGAFNPDWYNSPVIDAFRERAQAALESEFGASSLFVVKDPRMCRLLRFWVEAVEAFGATPLVVLPIRSPLEVAASLEARDGFDPSVAQLLWLRHVLDAEAASREVKRSFLRYDELLSQWQVVTDRLGDELGISWPRRSAAVEMQIEDFLSPTQRHHEEKDANVLRNPSLSRWIKSSFEILDRWSHGEVRETDRAELDRVRAAFDEAAPAFSRPVAAARQAAQKSRAAEARLQELKARIDDLEGTLASRDAEVRELTTKLRTEEARTDTLQAKLEAQEAEARALTTKLKAQHAQTDSLQAKLEAQGADARVLTTKLQAQHARADSLQARVEARERDIRALKRSTSWRVTIPLRTASRYIRWLLRNIRRALMLLWWLGSGQFSRTAKTLLPYYRRFVPRRMKEMIPRRMRKAARRRLNVDDIALPRGVGRSANSAAIQGEMLSGAKDRPVTIEPRLHTGGNIAVPIILYQSHDLRWQGAPNSLFEIASGIARRNNFHPCVMASADGELSDLYRARGIALHLQKFPKGGLPKIDEFERHLDMLAQSYIDLGASLVHANTLRSFFAVAAADRAGIPSVWNVRESEDPARYFDYLPPCLRGMAYGALSLAGKVVFVAEATRELWKNYETGNRFLVIPNGLDIGRMMRRVYGTNRANVRLSLGASDNDIVLLSVGTVSPRKGQSDLVEAIGKLDASVRKHLILVVVGFNKTEYSSDVRRRLEAIERDRLVRVHKIDETRTEEEAARVAEAYLSADLFVLCSRFESYPRVILEAMAFGLPIVTTPSFGAAEQVIDGESGLVYQAGDIDALARHISRLCRDTGLRRQLGHAAHQRLSALNSYESMLDSYEEVYGSLIRH